MWEVWQDGRATPEIFTEERAARQRARSLVDNETACEIRDVSTDPIGSQIFVWWPQMRLNGVLV